MKNWKAQKGFTLIELLIVIAILGILAAVVVPNLSRFIGQSKAGAANAELGMVRTAIAASMAEAGVGSFTLDAVALSKTHDVVISGTVSVGDSIQGTNTTLLGTYTIDASGNVTAATYPAVLDASGTPLKF